MDHDSNGKDDDVLTPIPVAAHADAHDDEEFDEFQDNHGGYYEFVNPRFADGANVEIDESDEDAPLGTILEETGAEESAEKCGTYIACAAGDGALSESCEIAPSASAEGPNEEEDEDDTLMDIEQARQLAELRLRQLDKEYDETSRPGGTATAVAADAGAMDEKRKKLAELRARIAAAKAAAAQMPMQFAPGADEFPDDYDALQQADTEALKRGSGSDAPIMITTAQEFSRMEATQTHTSASAHTAVAPSSKADDTVFDPFGTDKGKPAAAPRQPSIRPVSPLPSESRAAILSSMSRLKIVPKVPVNNAHLDRVVAAALERGKRSVEAHKALQAKAATTTS